MLANIISQTIIDEVIGNSEDSLPNKIKEKEESLLNTLNNRLTIPMAKQADNTSVNETKEDKHETEERTHDNHSENYQSVIVENEKEYELNYFSDTQLIEGNEKPINVKEHMIVNMDKKYSKLLDEQRKLETETDTYVEEPVEEDIKAEVKVEEEPKNQETEASHYGMPADIEQILVNTVDFDTTVVAINQTREKYKNVAEQANKAEHDAEESDKLLEKVSNEYSEIERQLKEKELKSKEIEKKILSLLNNEQNRLSQQMQEKETVIDKANKRKEENNGKIVDFKTKISSTLEKANEYDEMISKQEQLLNTLVEFNMNFEHSESKEKTTSRVA